jgi:hypothetical protein
MSEYPNPCYRTVDAFGEYMHTITIPRARDEHGYPTLPLLPLSSLFQEKHESPIMEESQSMKKQKYVVCEPLPTVSLWEESQSMKKQKYVVCEPLPTIYLPPSLPTIYLPPPSLPTIYLPPLSLCEENHESHSVRQRRICSVLSVLFNHIQSDEIMMLLSLNNVVDLRNKELYDLIIYWCSNYVEGQSFITNFNVCKPSTLTEMVFSEFKIHTDWENYSEFHILYCLASIVGKIDSARGGNPDLSISDYQLLLSVVLLGPCYISRRICIILHKLMKYTDRSTFFAGGFVKDCFQKVLRGYFTSDLSNTKRFCEFMKLLVLDSVSGVTAFLEQWENTEMLTDAWNSYTRTITPPSFMSELYDMVLQTKHKDFKTHKVDLIFEEVVDISGDIVTIKWLRCIKNKRYMITNIKNPHIITCIKNYLPKKRVQCKDQT